MSILAQSAFAAIHPAYEPFTATAEQDEEYAAFCLDMDNRADDSDYDSADRAEMDDVREAEAIARQEARTAGVGGEEAPW